MHDFLFRVWIPLMMLVLFGIIVFSVVQAIRQWSRNNKSPVLMVAAKVVGKRTYTRHDDDGSVTRYYATFQFEDGDRLELRIPRNRIGYLIEGDQGKLTYQGTRFLGFERI